MTDLLYALYESYWRAWYAVERTVSEWIDHGGEG